MRDIAGRSKYFLFIGIAFVAVLMISSTVAPKLLQIGPFVFAGGVVLFPLSYIFGDVLTEVYGYRASRKIIWSGFGAIIFMSIVYWLVGLMPAAPFWEGQAAYEAIFGMVPRLTLAGIIAFFAGEFANSYIISKMKIWSRGKNLWMRTIGSTIVGEGADCLLFFTIGFYGTIPLAGLWVLLWSSYLFKVLYEVVLTPATYAVVNKLKKVEGLDVYDQGIDYNPFRLAEE